MNKFSQVIGYEEIKNELLRIADTLQDRERYEALGAHPPQGVLLHGEPGVGKTLMANCLIESSGLTAFTCRKTESGEVFLKSIRDTFDKALEHSPAIVFLDDLDKFANDDERHRNSEEYVTVQSCIDEVRGKGVFVLATANDLDNLPDSLLRAGRFDRTYEVAVPDGEDAVRIVRHYLQGKKLDDDMDYQVIADLLDGNSCAVLETVMNEAGLRAGYDRRASISMTDIVEACLQTVLELGPRNETMTTSVNLRSDDASARVVWHEAGHAVVAELLAPGDVVLVCSRKSDSRDGMVKTRRAKLENAKYELCEHQILIALAGRAANEIIYGDVDAGAESDLIKASRMMRTMMSDLCDCGLRQPDWHPSEIGQFLNEQVMTARLEIYYRQARRMLIEHRDFLNRVATALAEKGYLLANDMKQLVHHDASLSYQENDAADL